MPHVVEINDIQALAAHRDDWQALLQVTPGATFFKTLEWLEVYWKHFGKDQRLRVLLVYQQQTLIGILPLVVRRELTRAGALRYLTYPLDGWGSFYGPLGQQPYRTLLAGLCHIRRGERDWDVLELRHIDAASPEASLTDRALQRAGLPANVSVWDQSAVIELAGTWDQYVAARSSKWRNNYRRWERRVAQQGHLEYLRYRPRGEQYRDCDPRWDLYDACEQIARHSWQGTSTDGTTLTHDSVRQYLRETHAAAVRAGAAEINLLLLDEQPVAFAYNYRYGQSVYGLRIGFDAKLASCGVGNLMYLYTIRDSFQRQDRFYDLGPGSLESKRHLHSTVHPVLRYSYYRPTALRAQLVRLKRWTDQWRSEPQPALSPSAA